MNYPLIPELIAVVAIIAGMLLAMYALIAVGARVVKWVARRIEARDAKEAERSG